MHRENWFRQSGKGGKGLPSHMIAASLRRLRIPPNAVLFPQLHQRRWATQATAGSSTIWSKAKRIILVRHGESEGNVDPAAYVTTPDWRIQLTDTGREQAHDAGQRLRALVGEGEPLLFYVSPYMRTLQTLQVRMVRWTTARFCDVARAH